MQTRIPDPTQEQADADRATTVLAGIEEGDTVRLTLITGRMITGTVSKIYVHVFRGGMAAPGTERGDLLHIIRVRRSRDEANYGHSAILKAEVI